MKKKLIVGLLGGMIALSVGSALAQPGPHGEGMRLEQRKAYVIQDRINGQEREIAQGIRNKSLTRMEARVLRDNLSKIKRDYAKAKRSDRYVSMNERARLDNMLDRNSRMIRRMENNGITRF